MRLLIAAAAVAALIAAPAAQAGGFVDVSFSDAQHGWALVTATCPGAPPCTAVESTGDGGRSWRRLATLPASAGLQRISRGAGMAFGKASFVATDGGRRWTRVPHLLFESVVPTSDGPFALTYAHSGCPAACDVVLRHAASGSGLFASVPAFRNPSYGFGDMLVAGGMNIYAMGVGHTAGGAMAQYAHLSISRDGGRTWSRRGDPCREPGPQEVDGTDIVAAGRYVALLCVVRTTGAGSIALSHDGGRSFTRLRPDPSPGLAEQIALDTAGDLAIVDSVNGKTARSADRLRLSYDGGRTWRVAFRRPARDGTQPPAPSLSLFGRSLRWAIDTRTLLHSDDAGRTWRSSAVPQ